MELSKMFGVERDTDFGVEGLYGKFRVRVNAGYELLVVSDGKGAYDTVVNGATVYRIIEASPSGIIHLPPPLTDEQREQLKAIWTLGGRWLAKDNYKVNAFFAFVNKPHKKDGVYWSSDIGGQFLVLPSLCVCKLVSWSDPEPFDIGKAVGVEG